MVIYLASVVKAFEGLYGLVSSVYTKNLCYEIGIGSLENNLLMADSREKAQKKKRKAQKDKVTKKSDCTINNEGKIRKKRNGSGRKK